MTATPATSEILSEMSACAYRLGVAFAAEAEAETAWKRKGELFQLFDRCFFGVRVAIALELRLARAPGRPMATARGDAERDAAERDERLEVERPDTPERPDGPDETHIYTERDRDRDGERVSLPVLLSTMRGVARDAAALPGPAPAALPTLNELLARVSAQASTAPARASLTAKSPTSARVSLLAGARASPAAPLCARLAGPAVAALDLGPHLPVRRATGPPRRR